MTENQKRMLHQLIADFADYSIDTIAPKLKSAQTVLEAVPHDINNPVILFLIENATLGVLESLLNKLSQTADLLDKASRDFGETGLQATNEICDVRRMRNTLLAHRMEVLISSTKEMDWYKKEYGSFEKAFAVLDVANNQLCEEAYRQMKHPKFLGQQVGGMEASPVTKGELKKLFAALKTAKIY